MSVRALLSEGPQYGLRLREESEDRAGEVWLLNVDHAHTTLQRLECDGLTGSYGSEEGRPQEAFRITFDGERELAAWLRTPPGLSSLPRHKPVMKVLIARRVPDA
jgi:DNA-binding PadR family transcriptional regulator